MRVDCAIGTTECYHSEAEAHAVLRKAWRCEARKLSLQGFPHAPCSQLWMWLVTWITVPEIKWEADLQPGAGWVARGVVFSLRMGFARWRERV